ncbi:MAG: hypothetical protein HGA31_06275 [Candidatus Moranbacteria bacterium]|nr:hypothetical protein [Candidatus Moranbacteria bacterium]
MESLPIIVLVVLACLLVANNGWNGSAIKRRVIRRKHDGDSGTHPDDIRLSDSVSRKDRYIYWKLMSRWYETLRGRSRNDKDLARRLRIDWLSYMELSGNRDTYGYLSGETVGDDSDEYRKKYVATLGKIEALEDSFAVAMGKKAVKELACVRDMDPNLFGPAGELAPKGCVYDTLGRLRNAA